MTRRLRPTLTTALAATAAVGAGAAVWGTLIERTMFTLRRADAPVLPAGSAPIRVLHFSDLHMAPWQRKKQEWLRSLTALQPDLIVDTGDNLGHAEGIVGIRQALQPFAGVPGVFVHGSNDYIGPRAKSPLRYFRGPSQPLETPTRKLDTAALTGYLRDDLGWTDLNNRAARLTIRGTELEFFGVDDPHVGLDRIDVVAGAVDDLRAEADGPAGVSIGVAHAPYRRILDDFVTRGADVLLAGHTHGGQVCVPGYGALVTNCDIPRAKVSGFSTWDHALRTAYLNVSAGVGTSIYAPVRFACRPEVTLLTLSPRP
ncbi:metallophosphoesterase [Microbacteriaceae bacterium VKM Ac-2855]|nr:metallophosphoesterase [Microbacteriaceae bacterium VKM Ac-2855]